nr:MAG TPA: hypothetical protein [Caudoviricetes sp.]
MLPTCCIVEATRLVTRPMPPINGGRHRAHALKIRV